MKSFKRSETFRQALRDGEEALSALCVHIASGLSTSEYVTVQISTETFDAVAYFDGHKEPIKTLLHTSCAVPFVRGAASAANAWWLSPAPAQRLAVVRVLAGGFAIVYLLLRTPHLLSLSGFRPAQFAPVGIVNGLDGPLPEWALRVLVVATLATAVPFVLGWRFQVFGPVFAVLLLSLLTYRNSFAQIFHTENLLVLQVVVLAVSPAAAAYSFDAVRRGVQSPAPSWEFGWPLRLMCLITVLVYVIAGVAKLENAGLEWATGDVLRNYAAYDNLRKVQLGDWHSPIGAAMVQHGWLFKPLAFVPLAAELFAPLALLGGRSRWLWVTVVWGFHVGIFATMAIIFPYQLTGIAFASFFAVERLVPGRWRSSVALSEPGPAQAVG